MTNADILILSNYNKALFKIEIRPNNYLGNKIAHIYRSLGFEYSKKSRIFYKYIYDKEYASLTMEDYLADILSTLDHYRVFFGSIKNMVTNY